MADRPRLASEVRDWVQTIAIVVGVAAGIWQFMVKEIWNPAAAPINLTTEVTVKEAGFRGASSGESKEQFEAIELNIVAKNPSSRDVYLLENCWYAVGIPILTHKESGSWTNDVTKRLENAEPSDEGAYYKWDKTHVVAAGEVFLYEQVLHPNESISTSHVFYVPKDMYDVLRVNVQLPTTAVLESAEAVWTVTSDQPCNGRAYRKQNGTRAEEIKDFMAAYLDRTLELQSATSRQELPLGQTKPPTADATKP